MSNDNIDIYKEKLSNFDNLIISYIHNNRDICFNSDAREILYAIQDSFIENNHKNLLVISFKECIYGKALVVRKDTIQKVPDFNNLIKYYKTHYFNRLNLLEESFRKKSINFNDLIIEKNLLISNEILDVSKDNPYYILHKLKIPDVTIKIIFSYLIFDYQSYINLRRKYEGIRRKYKIN